MTTYYVDGDTGSDTNSGLTEAAAFATIGKGVATATFPGDIVYIKDKFGGYAEEINVTAVGQSGNVITIQNYTGHTPYLNGGAQGNSNDNLPAGTVVKTVPTDTYDNGDPVPASIADTYGGRGRKDTGLLDFVGAQYVVWDGIDVKFSGGRGVRFFNGAANITLQNIDITEARGIPVLLDSVSNITLNNLSVQTGNNFAPFRRSPQQLDSGGGIVILKSQTITVDGCTVGRNWGEHITIGSKGNPIANAAITISDCVCYDSIGPIYIHAVDGVTVERCYIYRSATTPNSANGEGINVAVSEPQFDEAGVKNIILRNNIIANTTGVGITLSGGNGSATVGNVKIHNNTVINHNGYAISTRGTVNGESIQYINNIVYQTGSNGRADTTFSDTSEITANNNFWSSAVEDSWLSDATDVVSATSPIVNYEHNPAAGEHDANNYRLTSGSSCIDAAADLSAQFTDDYFEGTRGGWDIGAHEYDGFGAVTATAGVSQNTGVVSVTEFDFTGSAAGGTGPYTYAWNFGDGTTSTEQSPQDKIYQSTGTFVATLTVTDANDITDTDTETITVTTQGTSGGSDGAVNAEVVDFDAGAASFAVSGTPVAILFLGSGATANATTTNNAQMTGGVWASNAQYSYGVNSTHNLSTSQAANQQVEDYAITFVSALGAVVYRGAVSSVTSSTVNLTWTGTATAYKCTALVLYGSGLSALAGAVQIGTSGSTTTVNTSADALFVPTTLRGYSLNLAQGNLLPSLGIAVNGGGQYFYGHAFASVQSSEAKAEGHLRSGYVAEYMFNNNGRYVEAGFGGSSFSFTAVGGDIGQYLIYLAVTISGASQRLEVIDLPTSTGATDYTDAGFDAGFVLGIAGLMTDADFSSPHWFSNGARAASYSIFASDGTNARTVAVSNTDSTLPTVSKSYTNTNLTILDTDGTVEEAGAIAMITDGYRITLSTASGTARKALVWVLESTAAAAGPTADFTWYVTRNGVKIYPADGVPIAGETVQFVNLSNDNDGDSDPLDEISSHSWDVTGNGTEDYDDQDPTHSYTNPGVYSVSLTVANDNILLETGDDLLLETGDLVLKDADGNTNTITKTIEIQAEEPTASFVAADTTVSEGTAVELDASGSDAGSYTLNKYLWTFRKNAPLSTIIDDLVFRPGSEIPENTFRQETTTSDFDIILDPGKWSISLQVGDTGANVWSDIETKDYYVAVTFPLAVDFYEAGGGGTHPTSYEATFYALINTDDAGATYEWDFGDGSSSTGVGLTETTHEYTSVGAYDVALTVTLPAPNDASTDTTTKTDFITIVAAPTVPYTNAQLVALRADVLGHAGYMGTGTWAVNGSHANVWEMTLTRKWAEAVTVVLVKNGERVTMLASAATVQSAGAGNAYASYVQATGALTLGVYAASDPTNGSDKYYFLVEKQYDLRDEFYTPLAAGSVDGTDAEPGPGTRDVTDTGSNITISGGELTFAGGNNNFSTTIATYGAVTRARGMMLINEIDPAGALITMVGLSTTATAVGGNMIYHNGATAMNIFGSALFSGGGLAIASGITSGDVRQVASVLRDNGSFIFANIAGAGWKLYYATDAGFDTATLYPMISHYSGAITSDFMRIPTARWLPAPLASDGFGSTFGLTDGAGHAETSGLGSGGNGLAWTQHSGTWSSAAGAASCDGAGIATVMTTTADMLIDIDLTRDSGNLGTVARYTDADNYLRAYHDGTNAKLDEVVSGTPANLISAAATYAAGATLRLITDGTSARLYYNNALVGTTSGIDAGLTATNAGLYTSAATNAFDNFVVYARGTGGEHNIGLLHYAESPSRALLETGYAVLQENGDYLLLED